MDYLYLWSCVSSFFTSYDRGVAPLSYNISPLQLFVDQFGICYVAYRYSQGKFKACSNASFSMVVLEPPSVREKNKRWNIWSDEHDSYPNRVIVWIFFSFLYWTSGSTIKRLFLITYGHVQLWPLFGRSVANDKTFGTGERPRNRRVPGPLLLLRTYLMPSCWSRPPILPNRPIILGRLRMYLRESTSEMPLVLILEIMAQFCIANIRI